MANGTDSNSTDSIRATDASSRYSQLGVLDFPAKKRCGIQSSNGPPRESGRDEGQRNSAAKRGKDNGSSASGGGACEDSEGGTGDEPSAGGLHREQQPVSTERAVQSMRVTTQLLIRRCVK